MSNSGWFSPLKLPLLLLVAAALFFALDVPGDFLRWQERRRQARELEQINARLAEEIRQRRERLRRLQTSAAERERIIRQEQLRARPGEIIYTVPGAPKR